MKGQTTLTIGGITVPSGTRRTLALPLPHLYTQAEIPLQVQVINGIRPGPRLFLSAALHGDELNGIEIIRRVFNELDPAQLSGAVVALPVVNVFGLITQSRYLPDRRDLNRCFPGRADGSLGARLAHVVMTQVVLLCTHGVDLHTAGANRNNLPQIRANLQDPDILAYARSFGVPAVLHARERAGSLRRAAARRGIRTVVYEAGEPFRFNGDAIETGVTGIRRAMAALSMTPGQPPAPARPSVLLPSSQWLRARSSGILRLETGAGEWVRPDQRVGVISDPIENELIIIRAPRAGLVIGHATNPLVYRGDAVLHIGFPDDGRLASDETIPGYANNKGGRP